MTESSSIGRRIAAHRKAAGIATSRELADLIANPKISESVIQNIESGRKPDLPVSQLLEISYALGISPVMLLAPLDSPMADVDLVNVGPGISAMKAHQLDAWISSMGNQFVESGNVLAIWTRVELRKLLALYAQVAETYVFNDKLSQVDLDARAAQEARIDALVSTLETTVDLKWLVRPWAGDDRPMPSLDDLTGSRPARG